MTQSNMVPNEGDGNNGQEQNLPAPIQPKGYTALMCSEEEIHEFAEIFRTNLEGETLTERDLPRATVPPGGVRVWNLPGETADDEPRTTLRGVLVSLGRPRARWDKTMDETGGGTPPVCSSPDGKIGSGDPGGPCAQCRHNVWGSDGANGKACKEKRMLYLLQKDNILPMVVQAPSTSIEAVKSYRIGLANQRLNYYSVETELSLERVEGGFPYSRIILRNVGELSEEEKTKASTYISAFSKMFQQTDLVADAESVPAQQEALETVGDEEF